MKETVDHQRRQGKNYIEKPALSPEERQARSEQMKKFNRKTGKATAMGNRISESRRKAK